MKLLIALSAMALAAAHAPPRIELDMASVPVFSHTRHRHFTHAYKLKYPIYRSHDRNLVQPDLKTKVMSKQEVTMSCRAGVGARAACKLPTGKAWDFMNKNIAPTKRIFLIDV